MKTVSNAEPDFRVATESKKAPKATIADTPVIRSRGHTHAKQAKQPSFSNPKPATSHKAASRRRGSK
jgi:hypothetical protein